MLKSFCRVLQQPRRYITQVLEKKECLQKCFQDDEKNELVVPVFKKSLLYLDKTAIQDSFNKYSYLQLYISAKKLATQISNICGGASLSPVGFFGNHSSLQTIVNWGTWISGQVSVPLNLDLEENARRIIQESEMKLLIATPEFWVTAKALGQKFDIAVILISAEFVQEHLNCFNNKLILQSNWNPEGVMIEGVFNNDFYTNADAFMLPYIGSKNELQLHKVKHETINSQVNVLQQFCQFTPSDHVLFLVQEPYSFDSTISSICLLSNGAEINFYRPLNEQELWNLFLDDENLIKKSMNVCVANMFIYKRLVDIYENVFHNNEYLLKQIKESTFKQFRLMVCTNTSIPNDIKLKWFNISGHNLCDLNQSCI